MAEEYEPLPESLARRRIRTNHKDHFSLGARPEERQQTVNPNQNPRDLLHEGSQQTRPLMWSPGVGTPRQLCSPSTHTLLVWAALLGLHMCLMAQVSVFSSFLINSSESV